MAHGLSALEFSLDAMVCVRVGVDEQVAMLLMHRHDLREIMHRFYLAAYLQYSQYMMF